MHGEKMHTRDRKAPGLTLTKEKRFMLGSGLVGGTNHYLNINFFL